MRSSGRRTNPASVFDVKDQRSMKAAQKFETRRSRLLMDASNSNFERGHKW